MQNIEQFIESRISRRIKAQDRALTRLERREARAEKMIGTLIREGKEVYYAMPQGGQYREGQRHDLVAYLIRNNHA